MHQFGTIGMGLHLRIASCCGIGMGFPCKAIPLALLVQVVDMGVCWREVRSSCTDGAKCAGHRALSAASGNSRMACPCSSSSWNSYQVAGTPLNVQKKPLQVYATCSTNGVWGLYIRWPIGYLSDVPGVQAEADGTLRCVVRWASKASSRSSQICAGMCTCSVPRPHVVATNSLAKGRV